MIQTMIIDVKKCRQHELWYLKIITNFTGNYLILLARVLDVLL